VSPRPRKASDEQIFAAAHRMITTRGPAQWTLADVAAEAGITAGAIVQRFGSKRGLMIALTRGVAAATSAMFQQLRAGRRSPLAVIRAYADCVAQMGGSREAFVHNLAYLQVDLGDPELHKNVREQARATRGELAALVAEAVAAGELVRGVEPEALARAVEVTCTGSLMTWAIHQDGTAQGWLRHDLDELLRPYLPKRKAR
jgi:AcrR family transcriptional regulator